MNDALAVIPNENCTSTQLTRRASDAAGACKAIVQKTAVMIGKKKYVPVEGWQAIANSFGCVASARDVEVVDGGIRAIGEVRRMDDGRVIATAEGFVGNDEGTWTSRAEYARRAMAQTRGISRACRSAFAFVVTLMDVGLETTPAEEMEHADGELKTVQQPTRKAAPKTETTKMPPQDQSDDLGPTPPDNKDAFFDIDAKAPKVSQRGSHTAYSITLPDKKWASTLNAELGEALLTAAKYARRVRVFYIVNEKGYRDITAVKEIEQK